MKFKVFISFLDFVVRLHDGIQGESVKAFHFSHGSHVFFAEVENTAEHIANGVAYAAVSVHKAAHDFVGKTDVFAVIDTGYPKTQKFRTVFVDDFLRGDDIADGFGHFSAGAVHDVAMG